MLFSAKVDLYFERHERIFCGTIKSGCACEGKTCSRLILDPDDEPDLDFARWPNRQSIQARLHLAVLPPQAQLSKRSLTFSSCEPIALRPLGI